MNWIWFGGLVIVAVVGLGIVFLMEYKDKYFDSSYDEDHEHESGYVDD